MRTTTAPEKALLHNPIRSDGVKVEIVRKSNSAVVDVTDIVTNGSIVFSSDNRVATCSINVEDSQPACNTDGPSPYLSSSSYNSPDQLFWPKNEIKVYFGVDDYGTTVADADKELIFHGILGDSIGPGATPGKKTISMQIRDQAKTLQDTFIKGEFIYGDDKLFDTDNVPIEFPEGSPVVAVIQGILNDNFTWDKNHADYKKLHVQPTLDGDNNIDGCPFIVYPVKIGNCSVWDAINKVIGCTTSDDIGYELRYHFLPDGDTSTTTNEGSTITISGDGFYLTLLEIDQSKSVDDDDVIAGTDSIEEYRINIFDDTIRNDIWGVYYDRATKERMEINRQDSASIAAYGKRTMVIGQADVPFIDTYNEMWNLMGVALNVLKDVPATDAFKTQLMYHIEPNDLIGTTLARLTTGTAHVGITKITHNFSTGGGVGRRKTSSTSFTGVRDKVTGSTNGYNYKGNDDPSITPGPELFPRLGTSSFYQDADGSYTKTVLIVEPLPEAQVEYYEWRYAVKGTGEWIYAITSEPIYRVPNQPPNTDIAWSARVKLTGGHR